MARTNRSRFPSYPPDLDPRLQNYLESIRRAVEDVVVGDMAIETATFEGAIYVDTIAEYTAAAGVTIDSCLIKDGVVSNAGISQSSVTQHQAALSIACTQLTGNMPDARIVASNVTQHNAALDHGVLAGIGDDDHSIYALLAGRAGGQTLIGSTAASENLTLYSTSHATKGLIQLLSRTTVVHTAETIAENRTALNVLFTVPEAVAASRYGFASSAVASHTTGTVAELLAGTFNVYASGSGGTTSSLAAFTTTATVGAGATATSLFGINIQAPSIGGTVTLNYGIYINSITGGGSGNHAIYTNAGLVRFGDDVHIASGKVLKVNSIQVLGAQGAVVADATGAGDIVAQFNTWLARARAHGFIAT